MKSFIAILSASCLCLASCAPLTAFVASPLGQATMVTAAALGKQLAKAAATQVLEQIILKADTQINVLNAQGINSDLAKEIVRTSEIAGLQAVYEAAQTQYAAQTGARYIVPRAPKNPVLLTP